MKYIPSPIIILLLWINVSQIQAKDSLNLIQTIHEQQLKKTTFLNHLYLTPSQMIYSELASISQFNVNFFQRKNDEIIAYNQGKSNRLINFKVNTLVPLSTNEVFYGDAYYTNSIIKQTNWNTTSDFERLYPYIMSDTVGGDLKAETYYFKAGYTKKNNRFSYGASLAYRGLLEYRPVDPRPKNTVADLSCIVGGAVEVVSNYNIGIDIRLEKYKQSNEVDFFSELGATPLYHFVGLGRDYARFYGDKKKTQFDGKSIQTILSLLHRHKNGWIATIEYGTSKYDKIIHELNNLPMAKLAEQKLVAIAGYQRKCSLYSWGITATTTHQHRKGTENIFGDAVANEYPKIAKISPFYLDKKNVTVRAMGEWYANKKWTFSLQGGLKYNRYSDKYIYPKRQLSYSSMLTNNELAIKFSAGKNSFSAITNIAYKKVIAPALTLEEKNDNLILMPFVYNLYDFHTADVDTYSFRFIWHYAITPNYLLVLGGKYSYHKYSTNVRQNKFSVVIGIVL